MNPANPAPLLVDTDAQARFRAQCDLLPGTGVWPARGQQKSGDDFLTDVFGAARASQLRSRADLVRYFSFSGAPVGLVFTISRSLGLGSVLDYGMFLQNIALAADARGLQACVQAGWKGLADKVLPHLQVPGDMLLLCGMALGFSDTPQAPVEPPGDAAAVENFTIWHD